MIIHGWIWTCQIRIFFYSISSFLIRNLFCHRKIWFWRIIQHYPNRYHYLLVDILVVGCLSEASAVYSIFWHLFYHRLKFLVIIISPSSLLSCARLTIQFIHSLPFLLLSILILSVLSSLQYVCTIVGSYQLSWWLVPDRTLYLSLNSSSSSILSFF